MQQPTLRSSADAESYAAHNGVRLTAADREAIMKAQQAELRRRQSLETPSDKARFVEVFNRAYPRFLQALVGTGDVLMTLTQTVIVAFGVPVVLTLLLIVEQQRVIHGIALFESDHALADFAAWALVLLNLTLEFTVEYIESRAGYEPAANTRFSLRLWAANIAYLFGVGAQWSRQSLSPAARYKSVLRLVTGSILLLALAGSMRTAIEGTTGTWHQAVLEIITQSSLLEILVWIGGMGFALAAVLSARALSRYVAARCNEIVSAMKAAHQNQSTEAEAALDTVAAQFIQSKVAAQRLKTGNAPEAA